MKIIRKTESVCPHCLALLPASIYEKTDEVWMEKVCPEHGRFDVYLWPDVQHYEWFCGHAFPGPSRSPQTDTNKGCPLDCGLCPSHKRGITLPEIEVTWRCNLSCPVCFMFDDSVPPDPPLEDISRMTRTICSFDGPDYPLQITGGEPTVRSDLPDIIQIARQNGAAAAEVNTNGITIGRDIGYLAALKDAGLTNIYLQFDGLALNTTKVLRGKDILDVKFNAIENCRKLKIPVVLSATIVAGVNEGELSRLVDFSLSNLDVICGLSLQSAFLSGRFGVTKQNHLSVGDIARLISVQTGGRISARDFWPVGSSHPLCYGSTYLLETKGGYEPLTRLFYPNDCQKMVDCTSPQGAFFMDMAARSSPSGIPPKGLPILIMEYMDAWTFDLERAKECNLAVTMADGTSIPFCVYHLTNGTGDRLYPHGGPRNDGCT